MEPPTNRTQFVLEFSGATRAKDQLQTLRQLETAKVLRVVNAAVIARDASGNLSIHETGDLSPAARRTLISIGALLGFTGGVLWRGMRTGLIAAFVAGQTGALLMSAYDPGYSNVYLEHLAADVRPDSSLLVASLEFKTTGMAAVIQNRFPGARMLRPSTVLPSSAELAASV